MQDRQEIALVGMRLTSQTSRSLQYCSRPFVRRFDIARNIIHKVIGAHISAIE
jgi:hypothetical protein